jgi:dephospho-CoA kinase
LSFMPRQNPSKKITLGVTGIFGSGKSTVSGIFKSLGAEVLDADALAHRCLRRATPAYKEILRHFPRRILGKNLEIDRGKLAGVVFRKPSLLRKLNRILHPRIIRRIRQNLRSRRSGVVVVDAALLLEAGLAGAVDHLVVVRISKAKQAERLKKRGGFSAREAAERTRAQMPQSQKLRLADFIIDNNGSLEKTKKQVKEIWRKVAVPRTRQVTDGGQG